MSQRAIRSRRQHAKDHLHRLRIIQTPWFGVYLHKFLVPDIEVLHDHPWSFRSVALRGGYTEMVPEVRGVGVRPHYVKRFNSKRAEDSHYIIELWRVPTWTLICVGRRRREWGFFDPLDGAWYPHNEFEHRNN